mmetsp:Transcript_21877/g.35206  ORF Transcript_21877/g.35206 Transcript_21877/m.35206 type:complete len:82 (+) Transcript_21877:140-385(+)
MLELTTADTQCEPQRLSLLLPHISQTNWGETGGTFSNVHAVHVQEARGLSDAPLELAASFMDEWGDRFVLESIFELLLLVA